MGNNQNCVKLDEQSNKTSFQPPYKHRSLVNSVHYEEGNINMLINSKSSFFNQTADDNTDKILEENPRLSENPESFEIEINELLEKISLNNSEENPRISLNFEGKYLINQTALDIMNFFENLKKMTHVDLNLNNAYLNDEKFSTVMSSFKKHEEIEDFTLKISKNHLGYLSGKLISQLIAKLLDLKHLYINLSYNPDMSGNGLEELAENLALLKKLNSLKLEFQATKINSSDLFFLEFKESLLKMPNLTVLSLDLSNNFLKPNIISLFISSLQNLTNLRVFSLNLSYNSLRPHDLYDLSSNCSEFSELEEFSLNCNECGLSLSEYEIIYMGLARLRNLRRLHLDLAKNYNINKVLNYLVDYINPEKSFVAIEDFHLNLSFNLFQDMNYENLSFLLLSMKKLKFFDISFANNTLESKGFESLMCALAGKKALRNLKIEFRNCEIKSFEFIANSLRHIKSLRQLYLGFKTPACTYENFLNFLKILQEIFVEKFALELGEKIFHRKEIYVIIEKLSEVQSLKEIEFVKGLNYFILNKKIEETFKNYLTLKKKVLYQAYLINLKIKDKKLAFKLFEKLTEN